MTGSAGGGRGFVGGEGGGGAEGVQIWPNFQRGNQIVYCFLPCLIYMSFHINYDIYSRPSIARTSWAHEN